MTASKTTRRLRSRHLIFYMSISFITKFLINKYQGMYQIPLNRPQRTADAEINRRTTR